MDELVERVDDEDRPIAVVSRAEAIHQRWLHRVAVTICRDPAGRILVMRRPDRAARMPGQYTIFCGGAVEPGEPYEQAAARELHEELGIEASTRFLFKSRRTDTPSPIWLGVHDALLNGQLVPDRREIAWHEWMPHPQVRDILGAWDFPDHVRDAYARYARMEGAE